MKKILLISLTSLSLFASCPNISEETKSLETSKSLEFGLNSVSPVLSKVYFDILSKYNNNSDYLKYLTEKNIQDIGATQILGFLMKNAYEQRDNSPDSFEFMKAKKAYNDTLNNIDKNNKDWCNELVYEE